MQKKMLKADYVKVIESHFANEGKKLSNLSKATLPKLKEIIEKYDIKFDEKEMVKDINDAKEKEKQEQEERDKEWKIQRERRLEQDTKRQKDFDELTEDKKDDVLTYIVIEKQKKYLDSYWRIKRDNKCLKDQTDVMEEEFKKEGRNVERTGANTLKVNGINVIHGFYTEPFDWDYELKKINIVEYDTQDILKAIDGI